MSTIAQAKLDLVNLMKQTHWALAEHKLQQFRRHPDYAKALRKVWDTATDLKTTPDGKVLDGILTKNTELWLARADQEFIDEIIRNGG